MVAEKKIDYLDIKTDKKNFKKIMTDWNKKKKKKKKKKTKKIAFLF
jgi:ribonuclease HI